MLILTCPSKLRLLEGLLRKNLPRALAVHGAVMNINRGNPVGHEVIVDSWPEFKAVLTRPRREVASDDSDQYSNVYAAFFHGRDAYRTLLLDTDAVNWAQTLRIHGHQDGIHEVSQDAAIVKNVQLSATPYFTYLAPIPERPPEYQLDPGFTFSSLNNSHVDLLNETWAYGGNEQSRRYLATMLRSFPSACILDDRGQPISWAMMDPLGAMGNGYTLPSHRGKGYSTVLSQVLAMQVHAAGYPLYGNVALANVYMQKLAEKQGQTKLSELCYICIHSAA
ncbi:glycine N-acyltransferase-like protein 3 [Elgaria multicarinata webbii]|uniref:glycine N-acyltransferase-like protein 3 n=1 Tax=Elgaria multicarinata webbii TaxID=159646 RepID=UPI002FCD3964